MTFGKLRIGVHPKNPMLAFLEEGGLKGGYKLHREKMILIGFCGGCNQLSTLTIIVLDRGQQDLKNMFLYDNVWAHK